MFKKNVSYLAILAATAFEGGKAGWKLDADGKLVVGSDGNPIYVDGSGRELTVKGDTISELNREAMNHRTAKEAAETKLAAYKDIKDPAAALAAIQKLADIDQSKLIDSGKLDEVKRQMSEQFGVTIAELKTANTELQTRFDNAQISNFFASSDFIRERVAMPRDFFEASMRSHFKMVDGKMVVTGKDGNPVYSKKNMGEYADPNEALELLVEQHPQKDVILKASDSSGSGGNGNGGNRGGGRTIKRADFDRLNPTEQHNTAMKAGTGEITIVD